MPKKKDLPEGWELYSIMGEQVPGTKFIPFKVPLKEDLCRRKLSVDAWFTPHDLVRRIPKLKMVIDLTYTDGDRYYDQNILREHNIAVVKIKCAGGPNEVPSRDLLQTFIAAVDNFLRSPASRDGLIGVHCTHGLNRTGYFICKYMTDRMSVRPQRAIEDFEKARGHKISRPRLVADIMKSTSSFNSQSPLSNCYDDEGASFSRYRR